MRGEVQMYIRIIYPSTLIAIGGTALCLEQKNLGSETGPVEQNWDEGNNHNQINEGASFALADFSVKARDFEIW